LLSGNVRVANDRTAVNDHFDSVYDPMGRTTSVSSQRHAPVRRVDAMIDVNGNPIFRPIEAGPVQLREMTGQIGRNPSS